MKTKSCHDCKKEMSVAYRIQVSKGKTWIFVCPDCLPTRQDGEFYRYGGTWKGKRH